MNTKEYQSKEGNVLVGKDMSDAVKATILDVNTVTFGKGTDDERTTLQLTVKANDGGFEGEKVLALGKRTVDYLSETISEETDDWKNKIVPLAPVQTQTPDGTKTVSVSVMVAKKK